MIVLQQLGLQSICSCLVGCPLQILQLEQRNCLQPIYSLLLDCHLQKILQLEHSNVRGVNVILHGGAFLQLLYAFVYAYKKTRSMLHGISVGIYICSLKARAE